MRVYKFASTAGGASIRLRCCQGDSDARGRQSRVLLDNNNNNNKENSTLSLEVSYIHT